MEIKTSELSGPALRYATAMALGYTVKPWNHHNQGRGFVVESGGYLLGWLTSNEPDYDEDWAPDVHWRLGGPLIEQHDIGVMPDSDGTWKAGVLPKDKPGQITIGWSHFFSQQPGPLVAAMRALVDAKLGEEVEVPDVFAAGGAAA